jgi:agmatine deiminase
MSTSPSRKTTVAGFDCSPAIPQQPRWPAEWEPHAATWVTWPRNPETWPHNLAEAQREHAAFVQIIAEHEPVRVLAGDDAMTSSRVALAHSAGVELVDLPSNDAWMRDHGATFVIDTTDQQLIAVDWVFNAWGGKYPPFDRDQAAATGIAHYLGSRIVHCTLVMEGGALETDGQGTLLTTESCALDPIRNPGITRPQFEAVMRELLGIHTTVWLPGDAIIGDDTDGHIDQIARFLNPQQVAYTAPSNPEDPNSAIQQRNREALENWAANNQEPIDLVPLPSPGVVELFGTRLPASYCNFYLANDLVLVPAFGVPEDQQALGILKELYPDRRVVSSPSRNLLWGLGSFHCLTQQQPAVPPTA